MERRRWIPFIGDEQPRDEVFGFFRCIYKLLFLKVPLAGQDVIQSLIVVITEEGTETAQPVRKRQTVINVILCIFVHAFVRLLTACR